VFCFNKADFVSLLGKAKRLAQKPCPERSRMGRFEQSLCFEHKGLRLIGELVETNGACPVRCRFGYLIGVNPCLKNSLCSPDLCGPKKSVSSRYPRLKILSFFFKLYPPQLARLWRGGVNDKIHPP